MLTTWRVELVIEETKESDISMRVNMQIAPM